MGDEGCPPGCRDTDLAVLVASGDEGAFGTLFDRYAQDVYRFCWRRCVEPALGVDPDDLLSVVFLEAWRCRERLVVVEGTLRPWLLGIAANVVRNHRRSLRRYREALRRVPVEEASPAVRTRTGRARSARPGARRSWMDPLNVDGVSLDERRLRRRKDHLMAEISPKDATARASRRRPAVLVAAGAGLVVLTGGVALASGVMGGSPIWRQDDGSVAIDGSALRPAYHGRYLTADELDALHDKRLATMSANNRELACQGISLYFDTDAELQAYLDDFESREPDYPATLPPGADPCAPYADSPRFVTSG